MSINRLFLWAGDGPLNACDEVVNSIVKMVDLALKESEKTDSCWLNELMAYILCLNAVVNVKGGDALVAERVDDWKKRTLAVFDAIPNQSEREIRDDRPFIISVFEELGKLG